MQNANFRVQLNLIAEYDSAEVDAMEIMRDSENQSTFIVPAFGIIFSTVLTLNHCLPCSMGLISLFTINLRYQFNESSGIQCQINPGSWK